jgi:hypothetical protein
VGVNIGSRTELTKVILQCFLSDPAKTHVHEPQERKGGQGQSLSGNLLVFTYASRGTTTEVMGQSRNGHLSACTTSI